MAEFPSSTGGHPRRAATVLAICAAAFLGACTDGDDFSLLKKASPDAVTSSANTTKLVERDVEAPEVFSSTEAGLWDGRPSLGGVWAAHPDVDAPERVIIRNQANGKFVIGALFRREREIPGPRFQVSSDAAAALGLLAGQPVQLNVTALRREEVAQDPPADSAEALSDTTAPDVQETPLEPLAAATAAIVAAEAKDSPPAAAATPTTTQASTPTAQSEVAPKPPSSKLAKPYVQIGIFSVQSNAQSTSDQMASAGLTPLTKKTTSGNKTFWRVLVGPASSKSDLTAMIKKVHGTGFTDAYAVTN